MKSLILLAIFIARSLADPIFSEDYNDLENSLRIVSGVDGKKTENLDFCWMTIRYYQKQKICGCLIVAPGYVATTARCVYDCSEQTAVNITVNFPQLSGKDASRQVRTVYIPDGVNGAASLPAYDSTMDTPTTKILAGNAALIRLESTIPVDEIKVKSYEPVDAQTVADFLTLIKTENYKLRACGVGFMDNKGTRPKGVVCTDLNLVDSALCRKYGTEADLHTVPDTVACLQWSDRDNNLCAGDYGGPIYAYKTNAKGEVTEQKAFCMAIGSPDVRRNAQCQDGHTVFCQFLTLDVKSWLGLAIADDLQITRLLPFMQQNNKKL